MLDPELLERITARRAELDELEEQLDKWLGEVRAERDELAVAERVLERVTGQFAEERSSAPPTPGQVGGRAVMLIPHHEPGVEEDSLPWDYQRIIAAVRQAAGPVMAREVGELPGHPFEDAFGDGEFVPLGAYFRQLFGQLFFEFVQFRATRGDPFQQLGIQHGPDGRRPPGRGEREPTYRPMSKHALVAELSERDPVVDIVLSRTVSLVAGPLVEAPGSLVVTQHPQS